MSAGGWMMAVTMVLALGTLAFVIIVMVRTIRNEWSRERSVWREFALGLSLMVLFFGTWVAHGIAEWQTYTDDQQAHGEEAEVGDFVSTFSQSTLENWQSEFLQLFSFVVLAALFVHRGSAESKDSDERMEASLRRIEESLGTLPREGPTGEGRRAPWQLPDTPMESAG
jgi:heme A synthase